MLYVCGSPDGICVIAIWHERLRFPFFHDSFQVSPQRENSDCDLVEGAALSDWGSSTGQQVRWLIGYRGAAVEDLWRPRWWCLFYLPPVIEEQGPTDTAWSTLKTLRHLLVFRLVVMMVCWLVSWRWRLTGGLRRGHGMFINRRWFFRCRRFSNEIRWPEKEIGIVFAISRWRPGQFFVYVLSCWLWRLVREDFVVGERWLELLGRCCGWSCGALVMSTLALWGWSSGSNESWKQEPLIWVAVRWHCCLMSLVEGDRWLAIGDGWLAVEMIVDCQGCCRW